MSVVAMCVPGMHPDIVPGSSYAQESQLTTDGPGWGEEPAFHAVLGKSAKCCVRGSGFLIFLRNYTAVVHRKDIFLSNCFPYLVFHYQRVSQCI